MLEKSENKQIKPTCVCVCVNNNPAVITAYFMENDNLPFAAFKLNIVL